MYISDDFSVHAFTKEVPTKFLLVKILYRFNRIPILCKQLLYLLKLACTYNE
jgi:hypothetical protein